MLLGRMNEDHITTVRKMQIEMVMGTLQNQQDLQRGSYRARYKDEEGKADRKRDRKTIHWNGRV